MRRLITRALVGAALLSLMLAAPALAAHSWSGYHWAAASTSNPDVRVPLVNKLTLSGGGTDWPKLFHGDPAGSAGSVVHDWSNLQLFSTESGTTWRDILETPWAAGANTTCDTTSGQVTVCNGNYGETGWLGIAQISVFKSHIRYGIAKVNDTYLDTWAGYDNDVTRQHVLCQEVGHTFGLGHQDETGADFNTCMDYARPHDNAHPNAHDSEQIHAIYTSHTDGSKGGGPGKGNGKSSVQRLGKDVYVERFENGVKVFTHVTWVDDAAAHRAPNDRVPH